jgi:hypothetical protein
MTPDIPQQASQQGAFRRLVNLGMLIGGFGIGQGSIFLAQTWLVATDKTELLALFGTHFSFAMLGIIAVEAGSLTVLSAQIARILQGGADHASVWRSYWETTVFRLTVAMVLVLAGLGVGAYESLPDFSRAYLLFSLPALAIWAFNAAGFLDGLQKSGVSGITGSIAYLASAAAIYLAADLPDREVGMWTGLALSCGYALTIIAQFVALALAGWRPHWVRPTQAGVRKAFVEEGSMLAGLLPGQLYFRAQLAIAGLFLGTSATAMLVYAKQIVGAASQIAGFARRIEFPRLVQAVAANPATGVLHMLRIQRTSFWIAGLFTLGILAVALIVVSRFSGFTHDAWAFLAVFCLTILTESVGQALVQGLFAHDRYHLAAMARILAVAFAVIFSYLSVSIFGAYVFVLSDFLSHATVIGLSLWWLMKVTRADADRHA